MGSKEKKIRSKEMVAVDRNADEKLCLSLTELRWRKKIHLLTRMIPVTMASGKIQYYQSISNFQKLAFGTAGGRVVIADMASSSVQNDFHITDGPVWGFNSFDNAEKLAVAGWMIFYFARRYFSR